MSQAAAPCTHPLLRCVQTVADALDQAAGYDPDWLPAAEKADLLVGLARQAERLDALRIRVLAGAEDLAEQTGCRSAAAWLAHQTRSVPAGWCTSRRSGRPWPGAR